MIFPLRRNRIDSSSDSVAAEFLKTEVIVCFTESQFAAANCPEMAGGLWISDRRRGGRQEHLPTVGTSTAIRAAVVSENLAAPLPLPFLSRTAFKLADASRRYFRKYLSQNCIYHFLLQTFWETPTGQSVSRDNWRS
jgi:hypothetical protein